MARSLERGWEEKLRAAEAIEQDYERWRSDEPLVLSESDRQALQKLGEDLPGIWHAPSTTSAERKAILRLIIGEVVLDQKASRARSGSRSCGIRERQASILSRGGSTPMATTSIWSGCGAE
ncbi:hypothetical protein EOA27_32160 [Mesorhizobium sp. M2A.F.Ca.ET.037.01.1.1]|uniref:hypothetical protein n=1 Tax=Mesorhizobium sp. M2A.F.Ca.ET.037.01.1.1 TaxID=2496748 RepID=UPI000FCC35BF|nr:hypothetical protein [Mesorhizobium sp. M2A.F.Ca.ET.037.01.1.1]RUX02441.1 hypothetical protein EOA27_32160 [Mesorhizobium sp. M2A.F.Ca.ET.037.01.1.1]